MMQYFLQTQIDTRNTGVDDLEWKFKSLCQFVPVEDEICLPFSLEVESSSVSEEEINSVSNGVLI